MSIATINDYDIFFERDGQICSRPLAPLVVTRLIDLVELGLKLQGRTIWVVPRTRISKLAASDPRAFTQPDELVDVRVSKTSKGVPMFVLAWRREGRWKEREGVKIVFPEHDSRWPFGECVDPRTLLTTVTTLEDKIACPVEWGPGHVGQELIKQLNAKRPEWIRPSQFDPFIETCLPVSKHWKKPLAGKGWLHIVDRNSDYLGSTTGTNLGAGNADMWQSVPYNPKLPGLWEIYLSIRPNLRFYPPGRQLLWTPEVEYLRSVTSDFIFGNSMTWPEYHQTLRTFGEHLWTARSELKTLCNIKAANYARYKYAYEATKSIATQGLGMLAHSPEYGENVIYRPDWWGMLVSDSNAKALFKIRQLEERGLRVVWLNADAIGVESDEAEVEKAIPGILDRQDWLGGFKHAFTGQINAEMIEHFSEGVKWEACHKYLLKLKKEAAVV